MEGNARKQKPHKPKKGHPRPSDLPLVIFNDDQGESRAEQTQTLDRKKYKKRNLMATMKLSRDDSELPDDTSQLTSQFKKKLNKNISIRLPKPKKKQSDLAKDWEAMKAKNQKFKNSGYFGQPLEAIVEPGELCPSFVKVVIKHVEAAGLQSEGLYRISGNKSDIEAVMEKFESNASLNLQEIGVSVHAITGALKNFFKLLPDPLIPHDFGSRINDIMIIMDADERLRELQGLVHELPKHNLEVFKLFMIHLKRVTEHKAINKMDVRNLQTVLYPTLMRPAFDSLSNVAQNLNMGLFIQTCIEQASRIFDGSEARTLPNSILSPPGEVSGLESPFEFDLQQSLHGDDGEQTSLMESVLRVESVVNFTAVAPVTPSKRASDVCHANQRISMPTVIGSLGLPALTQAVSGQPAMVQHSSTQPSSAQTVSAQPPLSQPTSAHLTLAQPSSDVPSESVVQKTENGKDSKGPTGALFLDLKSPSEVSKSWSILSPATPGARLLQSPSRTRKSMETAID